MQKELQGTGVIVIGRYFVSGGYQHHKSKYETRNLRMSTRTIHGVIWLYCARKCTVGLFCAWN